ncbi:hypothetical protein [Mycobacteroides saopaulense]|nr:hypothetical protein [Mycobacteroides saopaulense]
MIDWSCMDCGVDTDNIDGQGHDEYYMIHDDLWLSINLDRSGYLCIACVEERLGRHLTPADFTDARINRNRHGRSEWLTLRLGHMDWGSAADAPGNVV